MNDSSNLNYDKPIEIADGVFWVGFADKNYKLHCNPYLIIDGDEAVVIDGGSRPDFSTVMIKILQTGINPNNIFRLIYQHYDPDLCGSIPHFEDIIKNDKLRIISHKENNIFIKYYSVKAPRYCIDEMGLKWSFSSGRTLRFIRTPYSHSPGSFVTLDEKTGVLFSSDIFGSYDDIWELFLSFSNECKLCNDDYEIETGKCNIKDHYCPLNGLYNFHKRIMTSGKALRFALNEIKKCDINILAPQHGSIIKGKNNIAFIIDKLEKLEGVGIDGVFSK
jgi:flavorubredoxin